MNKIAFSNVPHLVFGAGVLNDFKNDFIALGKKRLFLLTIPPLRNNLQPMLDEFAACGIDVHVDDQIAAEPTFDDFNRLRAEAKAFAADSVVGIGGGSVMDTSKYLAAMIDRTEDPLSFVGIGLLKGRNTYLACLPTTAGTGSEVSPNAIFLDLKDGGKKGVISPSLVPDASYIDPELTLCVPPSVTAATGIDAFTHCMESFVNKFSHPAVDIYGKEGMRLIGENLIKAVKNGKDIEARSAVALGSLYGGLCLGPVNTGAIHALSYPLGSRYHIAHGLANALLMPYVVEYNMVAAPEKYAFVARTLGAKSSGSDIEVAAEGVALMKQWLKDCGLPTRLSEINLTKADIEIMATEAMNVQRLLRNNIREVTRKDAVSIYENAY